MGRWLRCTAVVALAFVWSNPAAAQPVWTPPPEPAVRPEIPDGRELDADGNQIEDRIDQQVSALEGELRAVPAPARSAELRAALAEAVRVELVFSRRVTQQQIDAFLALGGEIEHMFLAVSYGWTGSLRRDAISLLPGRMGAALVVVVEDRPTELYLDEATRTGRVRPVWASGFAGSVAGFDGDSNITIAIMDTGIDDSHTDLASRQEYWADYTTDSEATPRDVNQHGTHVTGIALGTGAAHGSATATLTYTDSGDMTSLAPGYGFVSYLHLPAVSLTFTHDATWLGGGSTDLFGTSSPNGGGGLTALSASTFGPSGIVEANTFTPSTANRYSAFLGQNAGTSLTRYAIVNTVTSYPTVGDGFNTLRGVCPTCRWAGAKIFLNTGGGSSLDIHTAMDDLVTQRITHNIKVANLSGGVIGSPGLDVTARSKANTMVDNGIVTVIAAGNDGPGTGGANVVDDPGRAAKVLTVAASNDINELTSYSSSGFLSPGSDEDLKPDVVAPGGSDYYSQILSVDSNDADAQTTGFADRVSNDYYNIKGTSMATPFAAGSAALIIDALQQAGLSWSFGSSAHPLRVKMLACASATETNAAREALSGFSPTLDRAAAPKDRFEGYGLINPDAAIEAVTLSYSGGAVVESTAGGLFDRRAWGRNVALFSGGNVSLTLTVPGSGDFDLYLYSETPDSKGNPVILASSTNAGTGVAESISFTATAAETGYLFVKRVSGSGTWTLSGSIDPTPTPTATANPTDTLSPTPTPTDTPTMTPTNTPPAPATCAPTPLGGCDAPGKSLLLIKNMEPDDSKDKFVWKWLQGPMTAQGDFGNPDTGNTHYTVCVYDDGTLVMDLTVTAGAYWDPISTKGYKYKDTAGSAGGVTKVVLKGGAAGKAKILFKGKGASLPEPSLPLAQTVGVTVQLLRSDNPKCWGATYPPPAIQTSTTQFKDKF